LYLYAPDQLDFLMLAKTTTTLFAAATAAALASFPAVAQDRALQFELGLGVNVAPAYEGADEYTTGPTGGAGLSGLNWGFLNIDKGDGLGVGFGPSFRYLAERNDKDHARLTGIDDVDAALELGGKISYRWQYAEVSGAVRMGVTGHEGLVMDLGADAVTMPAARTEFRVGPRLRFVDDAYADTYFSVPTGVSLAAYDAGSGLQSYGLEMSIRHDFNEDWAVKGTLGWNRLTGSIGDSPVVQERDAGSLSVLLYRKFDWRW